MPTNHFAHIPNEIIAQLIGGLEFNDHSATRFAATCGRFWTAVLPHKLKYQRDYIFRMVDEGALTIMYSCKCRPCMTNPLHAQESTKREATKRIPIPFANAACGAATYHLRSPLPVRDIWCLRGFIETLTGKSCTFSLELHLDPLVCLLGEDRAGRILSAFTEFPGLYLRVVGDLHARGLDWMPLQSTSQTRTQTSSLKLTRILSKLSDQMKLFFQRKPFIRTSLTATTGRRTPRNVVPSSDTPRLRSFDISSPILFRTSFYPFTLHLLNKGRLTQLVVHNCKLSTSDWSRLLPSLTLEHLTTLVLICTTVAFSDFLIFLGRHPLIRCIALSGSKSNYSDRTMELPVEKQTFFPKLHTVIAGVHHILYFLDHIKTFSKLEMIMLEGTYSACCRNPTVKPHDFSLVFDKLSQIQVRGRFFKLILVSLYHSGLFPWFLGSGSDGFGNRKNILCVQDITVKYHGWQLFDEAIITSLRTRRSQRGARVEDHVCKTLPSGNFSDPAVLVHDMLIEIFPNVKTIDLADQNREVDH